MGKQCVVGGCSNVSNNSISLHKFPQNPKLVRLWNNFVKIKRADWKTNTQHSVICSAHFREGDFDESAALYQSMGLKKRRFLKADAIPCIQPNKIVRVSAHADMSSHRKHKSELQVSNSQFSAKKSKVLSVINLNMPNISDLPQRTAFKKRQHISIVQEAIRDSSPEPIIQNKNFDGLTLKTFSNDKASSCHIRPLHRSKSIMVKPQMINQETQTEDIICNNCGFLTSDSTAPDDLQFPSSSPDHVYNDKYCHDEDYDPEMSSESE